MRAARSRREAERQSSAQQAIAGDLLDFVARGERARIARELHDVVAHHISMIAVQSEAGRLSTPGMPAAGPQRFATIGDTARAALMEMRRLLGVLREDAEIDAAERRPQPGLAHLNELFDAVRVIAAGDALLAPAITRRLIGEFAQSRASPAPSTLPEIAELTPREVEVLRLIAEGLSNQEIAGRLFVTEETVKTHVSHVLGKLRLRDRTQAVIAAYEAGLVVPGSRARP